MTDSPDLDLAPIEARLAAATEGPWEVDDWDVWAQEADGQAVLVARRASPADAEFIAHARTDIPLLVTALEEANNRARMCAAGAAEFARVERYNLRGQLAAAESARDALIRAALAPVTTDETEGGGRDE